MTNDHQAVDAPVRRLLERIAAPASASVPEMDSIGRALADLTGDLDYVSAWARRLGDTNGLLRIHAPERGPRLTIVHRPFGTMSAVHSHATWIAIAAVSGLETHRRYRLPDGVDGAIEVAERRDLGPRDFATLLPPDDVHDHGHLGGPGAPAYVLILAGDDQTRFERHEWDAATGRHRVLPPGEPGRWVSTEPWPSG